MVYEILRDYKTNDKTVETSTNSWAKGKTFNKEIVIVPVLRAGLGMVSGIEALLPQAKIGHIGVYRYQDEETDEETFKVKEYFYKMPHVSKDSEIILVDPILATGVSAVHSLTKLKDDGFKNIKFVCLVSALEGIEEIEKNHPDVLIYTAAIDEKLNDKKYIIPGLGDAGDKIFGTK